MPTPATIRADYVQLALVARRARPDTRWAALSNGYATSACGTRFGRFRLATPSVLSPMASHGLLAVAERVRLLHGTQEVKRLFGAGIRALRADAGAWKVPA